MSVKNNELHLLYITLEVKTINEHFSTDSLSYFLQKHAVVTPLKIMPLGDSLTIGVRGTDDRNSGGYRTELHRKLVASGLKVEFVGSQVGGTDDFGSIAHEGHPGWTIGRLARSVEKWLSVYQPDLILLMIGTNDTKKRWVEKAIVQLGILIDKITTCSPNALLLVASIPPIHPAKQSAKRVLRVMKFNKAIPFVVKIKTIQGKKVYFVDTTRLTVNDLSSSLPVDLDNGLHLNAAGYYKLANLWYDAILKVFTNKQAISSISWR